MNDEIRDNDIMREALQILRQRREARQEEVERLREEVERLRAGLRHAVELIEDIGLDASIERAALRQEV